MGDRLALLAEPAVRSALALELRRAIEYHESLGSTQDRARALADEGAGPAVVVADFQREGRGTRDRSWVAPAGTSLLASWLFRPAPDQPALFTVLAGVAVARALASLGVPDARLKWPNDVRLGGKKVAGTLAHGVSEPASALVLGVGVNVHQRSSDFPSELRETAASLAAVGREVDRLALLVRLSAELDRLASSPAERHEALDVWRERSDLLGRVVAVDRPGQDTLEGVARELADDGALVVETAYGPLRIVAGEVRLRT